MTKQEALDLLNKFEFCCAFDECTNDWECEECGEAFNMAIEALEQVCENDCDTCKHCEETDGMNCYECVKGMRDNYEPTAEYSSDVISRQAAIDGVKTLHDVAWKKWHEPTLSTNGVLDMIRELPSAQPFTEEQIQTMQVLESAQIEKAYELGKADRPTGHWIENDNGTFSCSNCQSWIPKEQHHYARHCLYCGARMESEE